VEATGVCDILVPVDGAESSIRAVQLVIRLCDRLAPLRVHLLHVRVPHVPTGSESASARSAETAAGEVLAAARALLDAAGIPSTPSVATGYVRSTIVSYARAHGCDGIVMGTRGAGSTDQWLGSITRQAVQLAEMPVTLVK